MCYHTGRLRLRLCPWCVRVTSSCVYPCASVGAVRVVVGVTFYATVAFAPCLCKAPVFNSSMFCLHSLSIAQPFLSVRACFCGLAFICVDCAYCSCSLVLLRPPRPSFLNFPRFSVEMLQTLPPICAEVGRAQRQRTMLIRHYLIMII